MSIKKMYSLLDHTAGIFLNPLTFINDGDAIRWFGTVVNNKEQETNISKHPEQFTLYRLSDWNDKTGLTQPMDQEAVEASNGIQELNFKPKQIITGTEVQEEQLKTFTIKQLISMLKAEIGQENIINIAEKQ